MLFGVGNVFGDGAYRHIIHVRRAEQIENILYPVGHDRVGQLGVMAGHKQQDRGGDTAAQTVVGRGVDIQRERVEGVLKEGNHFNGELGMQRRGRVQHFIERGEL